MDDIQSRNVFATLEALQEHVGSAWSALRALGHDVGVAGERPVFRMGTVEYHLSAIDVYAGSLFQGLVTRLPAELAEYEGEPTG
jgi:hypothetical protein